MSKSQNNKELVAAGHEFARLMSSDTAIIEIAKMVTRLAERLDCTAAALREKSKQCDQLAAENAALKDAVQTHSESVHFCEVCGKDDPCSTDDVCYVLKETPATDAWQREQMAKAIRAALDECSDYLETDCVMDRLNISYEDAETRTYGAMELHDALVTVANRLRNGEAV